jgi:hypothetical protein
MTGIQYVTDAKGRKVAVQGAAGGSLHVFEFSGARLWFARVGIFPGPRGCLHCFGCELLSAEPATSNCSSAGSTASTFTPGG